MNETAKHLGIVASPYHPESNRVLEKWHSMLKAMLTESSRGMKEWDVLLPTLLFAYREATHEATGFSPFEIVFSRHVRGPLDLVKEQWEGLQELPVSAAEYLSNLYEAMSDMAEIAKEWGDQQAKLKYKELYDRGARERSFELGDQAFILMPDGQSKLEAAYSGLYTVEE